MTSGRAYSIAFAALCGLLTCTSVCAADALFPTPLHLVRRIDDPLAGRPVTVDEYCAGDRIVTVSGARTTIVDYARQEITEIDHRAATYSITPFSAIAAAPSVRSAAASPGKGWKITPLGLRRSSAGRSVDTFEIAPSAAGAVTKIEAGVDRRVTLSRAAAEALIGAAYPKTRTPQHDALLAVAAQSDGAGYALISEETTTFRMQDITIVVKSSLLSADSATVPPDVLIIDPGATRVESRLTRTTKESRELDQLPSQKKK